MQIPEIVTKSRFTVVGFEARFIHMFSPDATNFEVTGRLWNKFLCHVHRIPNRLDKKMFGIIYGRAATDRSHPDELQYIAGAAVVSTSQIPEGMVSYSVSAGTFAVFIHRGPIYRIGETVQEIYRYWLPQSDFQHSGIVDVELYDHRFREDNEESEMEYWISVKPR